MDDEIYAYAREKDGKKVVVMLNFTNAPHVFKISNNPLLVGTATDLSGSREKLQATDDFSLGAWGYLVYRY
jgi:alpha-amylase